MKVSVLMITYNHEKYIEEALKSILMQEVNFDYEIVIGEDCSTDNTISILTYYYKEFPSKIRLLLNDHNIGMHKNFINTYNACSGEYIALLEGDDFWCSKNKLQKQVDFLEKNHDYNICFHRVKIISDNSVETLLSNNHQKETSTFEDILHGNFIYTPSCVFRNQFLKRIPQWFSSAMPQDWALHILNSHSGKIYYFDECMAIYRMHNFGIWSQIDYQSKLEMHLKTVDDLNKHYNFQYHNYFMEGAAPLFKQLLVNSYLKKNKKETLMYLKKCLLIKRFLPELKWRFIMNILFELIPGFQYVKQKVKQNHLSGN